MNVSSINGKTVTIAFGGELADLAGFEATDYVTMTLAIKQLYLKGCDAALIEFDGEIFACEGLTVTPIGGTDLKDILDPAMWNDADFCGFCLRQAESFKGNFS